MITQFQSQRPTFAYRLLSALIAFTFAFSVITPPTPVYAQLFPQGLTNLPLPGAMVPVSPGFTPPMVSGITIHPENPLEFDFIIGTGDDRLEGEAFEDESTRLIKYFLAALTVPEEEMWVNLSPYEEDRVIPEGFGDTEMGRDLLAQDYLLKQLTASLMYPEDELGQKFWTKVRAKAYEKFGTTEIPMNTFNKIWIVPEEALVYEHGQSAFVVKSHLKVMLEEDYIALQENISAKAFGLDSLVQDDAEIVSGVSSEVVREVLIPEIEKEVNEGETFANLRQVYNSVILATWYKQNLKDSLLGQVYVGKNKTAGVDTDDKQANQKIYEQYVEAFKKGVYNYIREDYEPATSEIIPRKYFSGGADLTKLAVDELLTTLRSRDFNSLDSQEQQVVKHFSENGPGTMAVNVNLVEVAEGSLAREVAAFVRPAELIPDNVQRLLAMKKNGVLLADSQQKIIDAFLEQNPDRTSSPVIIIDTKPDSQKSKIIDLPSVKHDPNTIVLEDIERITGVPMDTLMRDLDRQLTRPLLNTFEIEPLAEKLAEKHKVKEINPAIYSTEEPVSLREFVNYFTAVSSPIHLADADEKALGRKTKKKLSPADREIIKTKIRGFEQVVQQNRTQLFTVRAKRAFFNFFANHIANDALYQDLPEVEQIRTELRRMINNKARPITYDFIKEMKDIIANPQAFKDSALIQEVRKVITENASSPVEIPDWFKIRDIQFSKGNRYVVTVDFAGLESRFAHLTLRDSQSPTDNIGFSIPREMGESNDAEHIAHDIISLINASVYDSKFQELDGQPARQLTYLVTAINERFDPESISSSASSPVKGQVTEAAEAIAAVLDNTRLKDQVYTEKDLQRIVKEIHAAIKFVSLLQNTERVKTWLDGVDGVTYMDMNSGEFLTQIEAKALVMKLENEGAGAQGFLVGLRSAEIVLIGKDTGSVSSPVKDVMNEDEQARLIEFVQTHNWNSKSDLIQRITYLQTRQEGRLVFPVILTDEVAAQQFKEALALKGEPLKYDTHHKALRRVRVLVRPNEIPAFIDLLNKFSADHPKAPASRDAKTASSPVKNIGTDKDSIMMVSVGVQRMQGRIKELDMKIHDKRSGMVMDSSLESTHLTDVTMADEEVYSKVEDVLDRFESSGQPNRSGSYNSRLSYLKKAITSAFKDPASRSVSSSPVTTAQKLWKEKILKEFNALKKHSTFAPYFKEELIRLFQNEIMVESQTSSNPDFKILNALLVMLSNSPFKIVTPELLSAIEDALDSINRRSPSVKVDKEKILMSIDSQERILLSTHLMKRMRRIWSDAWYAGRLKEKLVRFLEMEVLTQDLYRTNLEVIELLETLKSKRSDNQDAIRELYNEIKEALNISDVPTGDLPVEIGIKELKHYRDNGIPVDVILSAGKKEYHYNSMFVKSFQPASNSAYGEVLSFDLAHSKGDKDHLFFIALFDVAPNHSNRDQYQIVYKDFHVQIQPSKRPERVSSPVDQKKNVGGINLNPELLDLQIKRDGKGIPLPMNMQPILQMHIDGFVPVIINVTPVVNLPVLLGFAEDGSPVNTAGTNSSHGFDVSLIDKYRNTYVTRIESENDIDA